MIQPDDIRRKAERIYPAFLQSWLDGKDDFFPRLIPSDKGLDGANPAQAAEQVRSLRQESKEAAGTGYSVVWEERRSRTFGRNQFPVRITFETQDDFLGFIRRRREFEAFRDAVTVICGEFAILRPWIRSHLAAFAAVIDRIDGLIQVLRYLRDHPRPAVFARELPIPVDSKFVERHESVLRPWLDLVLPPQTIRADESHFERRYGLKYAEPHLLVRILDPDLQKELGLPWPEFSLPVHELESLSVQNAMIFLVENKVNLLTLPMMPRAIALGGLGDNIVVLRSIAWFSSAPVFYWGDLDVEGFEILSVLRSFVPNARSLLMDADTVLQWQSFAVPGTGTQPFMPGRLLKSEQAGFELCRDRNFRIEQEHIPQHVVLEILNRLRMTYRQDSIVSI